MPADMDTSTRSSGCAWGNHPNGCTSQKNCQVFSCHIEPFCSEKSSAELLRERFGVESAKPTFFSHSEAESARYFHD
jgi:hypothetical protein